MLGPVWETQVGLPVYRVEGNAACIRQYVESRINVLNGYPVSQWEAAPLDHCRPGISAPVIIVMFLATLGLGLVNRTAPQLNVFFLSMPVKSALGVAMLIVYLPFIMDMLMYTKDTAILSPVRSLLGG